MPPSSTCKVMLGAQVGNYEILSQLGEGGMGVVYLAKHRLIGRPAAVKVLRAEMSNNREAVNRFFNEARAATTIRHPGLVEIYDFGYLPDGSAYIIMEFLDGESLSDRILRLGRLPADHALAATRQIASALGAAHSQQIVHRDLKPDNVFIVRDAERPDGERMKLLDFGIAKLAVSSIDQSQTRTGEIFGTPTFMSPEQCRGAGKVDARSDLYSLGCLLYMLLCGRPPFVAEGIGDIIAHHLYFPPEPPRRLEPRIPIGVEQLVMSLLQKDPNARPPSAAAVIEAIDRLGTSPAVTSPPLRSNPIAQSEFSSAVLPMGLASPTTLSGTASQVRSTATPETVMVHPLARWILPSALGAAVVLGVVVVLLFGGGGEPESAAGAPTAERSEKLAASDGVTPAPHEPAPQPAPGIEPAPAPPEPVPVAHVIESIPPGAQVWLGDKQIGTTPFTASLPEKDAARTYTLRKKGYQDERIAFTGDDSASKRRVELRAAAVVPRPKPPVPKRRKPGYNPFE